MELHGMIQRIISLLLFTFLIFIPCLLRAWFRPAKELHPFLSWVRVWSKRGKEKHVFQQHDVLPGHEVAAKTMLSGFAFETAQSSLGVGDKDCIFCFFSHFFFFSPALCSLKGDRIRVQERNHQLFSHNDSYKDVHSILNTTQEASPTGCHSFPLNTT